MPRCESCGERIDFGLYCTSCERRLHEEQDRDEKEMREKFKRTLDKYKVSEEDKKELLSLISHMAHDD